MTGLSMATTWNLAVGVEAVTLERKTAEGIWTPLAVPNAKRRALTNSQEDQLGVKELVWHLWADGLDPVIPKREDRITDAQGVVWVIHQVELQGNGARHRCSTRRAVG